MEEIEDFDFYISIPINPFTEDNTITQEDAIRNGEYQYQMDSISKTIGTSSCRFNIILFLNQILVEMEDDTFLNFFQICLENLIEVYNLTTIEQVLLHRYVQIDRRSEIKDLLYFFENEGLVEVIAKCLPSTNPNIFASPKLEEFLNLHYNFFYDNLKEKKDQVPYLVFYHFMNASRDEGVKTLLQIILRNKTALKTQQVITNQGI